MNDVLKIKKMIGIMIFLVSFGYASVVSAASCYQCNNDPSLFRCGNASSSKCPAGWHVSYSDSCPAACRPAVATNITVTFNGNGGNSQVKTCKYYKSKGQTDCIITAPSSPSRGGYYFDGWSKTAGCPCKASRTSVDTSPSSSTTYYACWVDAYCWKCQYNGSVSHYTKSVSTPTASCRSSAWKSTSNPNGTGIWIRTTGNYCCGSTGSSSTPQPSTPTPSIPEPDVPDVPEIEETFCTVSAPNTDDLKCDNDKTLSSTCDKRTIVVDNEYADVTINQTGYISSVLTPDSTYAGSGFSFGVTYTNAIKWNYVDGKPNDTLHNKIVNVMNEKYKSLSNYTSALNITEIKFGEKNIDSSFLVKKCSNSGSSFYNSGLTVTCTFYIPDSVLKENGEVTYKNGNDSSNIGGISNKYYTPLDYEGNYNIEAKIVGMSRITDASAKADGNGTSWTGDWSAAFEDCTINIVPLLYKTSGNGNVNGYNFIYRPIDVSNPFPDRNAGINWFDWYSVENNRERLADSYSKLQYSAILDNKTISSIKDYNSNSSSGYFDWGTMTVDGNSTFVNEYFSVKRENIVGDNS